MKFGYCINMLSQPESDGSGREWIPVIARLGFDYAELPLAQMMAYDDKHFEELFIQPLQKNGLACQCCNNFFPAEIHLTGPQTDSALIADYAEKAMSRAKRLGAKKIVLGSSGARNYPAGFPCEKAQQQFVAVLELLEPIAASHQITLVLEHLNKMESNLLNSLREEAALAHRLQLPHIRCLMDNYHMMLGGGTLAELKDTREMLQHVHLARVLGRNLPCEGDETNWTELFAALKMIGYDGDCSIEAYVPQREKEPLIGESLRFLRHVANAE